MPKHVVLVIPEGAEKITLQEHRLNEKTGKYRWTNIWSQEYPGARLNLTLEPGNYRWSVVPKQYTEFEVKAVH